MMLEGTGAMAQREFRDFAEALGYYRNAAGLTQQEVADRVKLQPRTIQSYEGRARRPDADIVNAIANVLGCALLNYDESMKERERWPRERLEWEEERQHWTDQQKREDWEERRAEFVNLPRTKNAASASIPAVPAGRNRLQLRHDPFIGRESEMAEIRRRLLDPDVRLLTLTGPPGVGKTRLALEVADGLRDSFPDGVFSVSLAPRRSAMPLV